MYHQKQCFTTTLRRAYILHILLQLPSGRGVGRWKPRLGVIPHPLLGGDAKIHINFRLETNDWKNIWIPPQSTEIPETKVFYSEDKQSPYELIRPKLDGEDPNVPIEAGRYMCFAPRLKVKKKQKSTVAEDMIYLRPIIFPKKSTVQKWNDKGLTFEDPCTAGFVLERKTELNKPQKGPGIMEFFPSQVCIWNHGIRFYREKLLKKQATCSLLTSTSTSITEADQ